MKTQQHEDILTAAEHQVKQELEALSTEFEVKCEPVVIDEHQQLDTNLSESPENNHEPALKSAQIPDMAFTVRVEVKRESEVDTEIKSESQIDRLEPIEDSVLCDDASSERSEELHLKPKGNSGVDVWASNCDVTDGHTLQQIVDGCFVKLQRLRLIQCDVCNRIFQKSSQLVAHSIDHHTGDTYQIEDRPEKQASKNIKLYPCKICHEQFAFKCNMEIHKLKHSGREPYTCDICEQDFSKKKYLRKHMYVHLKWEAYDISEPKPCEICNKMFTNQLKLVKHVERHSRFRKLELHTCDVCDKQYKYIANLYRHKKRRTCSNIFSCGVCGRKFTKRSYLIEHTNIHEDKRPHVCEICEESFHRKDQLKTHNMIKHRDVKKITDMQRHECKICGKVFSRSYLVIHSRVHTGDQPYKCDVCEKTFHRKSYLTRHKNYHSNVKPFSCDYCRKSFNQKSDLVVHIRIHTGLKPYECNICKHRFAHKPNLSKHREIHHKGKKTAQLKDL